MKLKEAELLRNLTSSSTWMNQFSSTIANTALYKLVENFKLDIKRITMIVLIPISEWDEWYAFTVTMDSFSVGNSCTEDVRNQLQKEVLLRNFTLYFQYMKGDINTELASLGVTPPIPDILLRSRQPSFVLDHLIETLLSRKIGLLISPISFSLTINLHRRFNTMPSFSNLHQVEIALDIQGLEVRISMQELQQLLDVLNFVSIERIKARQLKKSIFQSHTSKSPALYWQYTYQAITTILQLHRGFDKVKLKQDLNQRIFSKQYAQQYHYYLCQQLQQYEVDMSKYIDEDDINEDYDEELLTKGEQELTVNALLATRMKVYFALLERQLPLRWLVHVLSHEDDHQQHLPKFISIRDRVQMSRLANDIKRQRQSVDVNGQKRLHFEEIPSIRAGDAGNSQIKKLNWKLQVAMDRLNLAVYASPHPHHHQQGGHSNTTTTSKRTSKHAYSTSKSHPRDNKFLAGNNTKKTSQASVSFSTTSTSAPLPVNINNRQDLLIKVTVNNIGLVMDSHGKKEELVVRLGIGSCQLFGVDKFCFMTWGNVEHTKSLADFKISIQQHACHGMQEFIQQHAFWLQIRTNKKMYNPHPIISNEVDDNDVDDKLNTEEVLPEEEDNSSGIYAGSIPQSKKISKFERSIYTFDVGGTVSHAFLKPTQSSINISLHCHDLNVVWDQKSFNKLGKTMKDLRIGLSSVVPTTVCSAEKMLLAQLSQYQSMDGVIEEPPKLNLEVSLDSVRVLFPIKQRNQHSLQHIQQMREEERILGDDDRCLQIFIQHVDIMSGDKVNVIAGVESRTTGLSADQSMEGGEEEERDRKDEKEQGVGEKDSDDDDDVSVTSNEHESSTSHSRTKFSSALEVKKLLEKLKNEIIRPHVFSVQEIHVGYSFVFLHAHLGCNMQCYYPTSRREIVSGSLPKIVDLPWNISGCWCPSIAMNHVNYTNHRLDIFCENLRMRVDTQDIIYMMRAVETCTHHHGNTSTTSHNKASNSALVMPRIQRLSGLSKLYLSVVLHAIEISFVDNKLKVDSIEEEATLLQKILLKYANGIQQHWDDAVINKVCRESSVRRFHNAGLSYFQALHILDLLRNAMTERHKVYSETELVGIITSVVMNYLHSKPAHRHLSHHQIEREDVLFKVKVSTVDMQFHQLTYDCKLWCFVRSLVLYDNYRTSICEFKIAQTSSASTSASPSPSDPQRRKSKLSEETSSKRRRHHGIVNPQSHQHHESQLVTKLQKSALNFVMIAKDDAHSFGQGGLHVRDVYGHIDNAWRGRRGSSTFDIALGCSNCWLEYDAKHIFAILMETTLIFDRIRTAVDTTRMKQHSATHSSPVQQQHSTSTKTSLPPHKANSPSKSGDNPILHVAAIRMEVDMKGFSVTLSNADKPFNHLNLVGCKVQLINTTGKFSIDGTVKSLSLYDLTLLGKLHRNVLWKQSNNSENSTKSEKFIEEPVLSFSISDELDALTGNSELRVTGHMSHLRVCFLYRFLTEILIYISVCIAQPMAKVWEGSGMAVDTSSKPMMRRTTGDLNIFQLEEDDEGSDEEMYDDMDLDMEPFSPAGYPDRNSVRLSTRTPPISSPPTVPAVKKIYIEVHLHELQGFVPRNSSSTDVIGLRIDHAMAKIYFTAKPWEAPDSNIPRNADQTGHLYFNTDVDGWVYGSGHHPANLNSTSTNLDTDDFFDAMEGDAQKHGHGGSAQTTSADDVLRIVAQLDNIFIFTTLCNENDTRKKRPYRVDSFLELLNVEDIAPGYHDCSHGHHVRVRQDTAWNHMASMQRWIQNSRSGFNLLMVLDISSEEVKLLFGDTASVSCLDVATSQAEFYLLVALWFDNIFEKEEYVQYTASKPVSASTTSAESDGRNSNSSNSFHPYGSKEYFTSILGRSSYFDLMVVRANVAIACATEVKYYSSSGPNAEYLKSLQKYDRERLCDLHPNFKVGNNEDNYLAPNSVSMMSASRRTMSSSSRQTLSGREVIPIAEAQAKSILLHVKNDSDGTRLFISGSDLIAFDCRQSTSTIHPLILRLASLRNKTKDEDLKYYSLFERNEVYHYGFTDFSFGLNSNSMNFQHHHQVPFQFSLLRSAASNWMTMNIGVDGADIKLEKVDLALLLADFFSVYFRFPEYGHPGVTAYTKLPPKDIPYGATDLRLFITRPHLAFVQNPMQLNSPALLVEADRGIYFRYIGDTAESTKFYLNGNDLAAVLVKRYRPPVVYRGARGSSGSGRGVRTTLEFLNFVFFYHYCAANHQSNIKFEIFNPEPEADENMARCADQVLDIYDETFGTDSIEIPEPTCLQSITQVKKEFPAASCDIVTCYEDIVFSVDVIKKFLSVGETKVSSPKSSHGSSNGNNSKPVSPTHQVKAPLIRSTGEQEKETVGSTTPNPANMYVIGVLSGIRFMLVDNVLGLHLPLFQVSVLQSFYL